jgi:hypothetical protein
LKSLTNAPPSAVFSVVKTSVIGTPSLRVFSRSRSTAYCGTFESNAVNTLASSGRALAAAMNVRDASPSCSTVIVPLRSCRKKLNPPEAPNPGIVGGTNGNASASGTPESDLCRCAMMAGSDSAGAVRSSHGLSRTKNVPKFGWNVLVSAPYPPNVL